ncbi:MAG: hypothetical protein ASARMPREDX12_002850 [Alectoria sarmentosa]|nr:MAG: hypothetical protein ASARMPREDX12_002850 [Alectoria sarmentosa]
MPTSNEDWAAAAPLYKQVERLTTPPCQSLLNRVSALLPLNNPSTSAFDNGCGTGVLTAVVKTRYPRVPLLATDASDGMIGILQSRIDDQKWAEVTARVLDSRTLDGIKDDSFTHTFSTFMVCLAPEPDKIVREMRRVTREGGVLGLAVWGDPYFGPFTLPWERACREFISDYKPPMLMDANWTLARNVEAGLDKAGFKGVEVWEEYLAWRWENAEAVSDYFIDGGNPANLRTIDSFKARGGDVSQARPIFERIVQEEWGQKDGSIELRVWATLATARK